MSYTDDRLRDYVDVAERIREFYERFPDGRLASEPCDDHTTPDRVCMVGIARRDPTDDANATGGGLACGTRPQHRPRPS